MKSLANSSKRALCLSHSHCLSFSKIYHACPRAINPVGPLPYLPITIASLRDSLNNNRAILSKPIKYTRCTKKMHNLVA